MADLPVRGALQRDAVSTPGSSICNPSSFWVCAVWLCRDVKHLHASNNCGTLLSALCRLAHADVNILLNCKFRELFTVPIGKTLYKVQLKNSAFTTALKIGVGAVTTFLIPIVVLLWAGGSSKPGYVPVCCPPHGSVQSMLGAANVLSPCRIFILLCTTTS